MANETIPKYIVRAYYSVTIFQAGYLDIGVYDQEFDPDNIGEMVRNGKELAKKYQSQFLSKPDAITIDRVVVGTPELTFIPVDDDGEPIEDEEFK